MNEGKKDRRDPIRTIKAKNPVAKNANKAIGGGAAGAHKDKKKAEKKGEVKHKKKEYAESYEAHLARRLDELSIDTLKNYKAKRQTQQDAAKAATPNPRTGDKDWIDQAVRGINMHTAQRKINRKEKGVAEGQATRTCPTCDGSGEDALDPTKSCRRCGGKGYIPFPKEQGVAEDLIDHDAAEPLARHFAELYYNGLSSADEAKMAARVYQQVVDGEMSIEQLKQHITKLEKEQGVAEDIHGKSPFELGAADAYYGRNFIHQVQGYGFEPGTPDFSEYVAGFHSEDGKDGKDYGNPRPGPVHARRITKTSEAMNGITGPGMMRDPAMEDEGDAEGLPHLTPELAKHIADQISTEGAHAIVKSVEWGDGAADELVQFIKKALEKVSGGMKEDSALTQYRKRSAQSDADFAKRTKQSKDKPGSTLGKTLSDLEKRYPPAKEGWTHDSLADQLFEHERTYEEQLQNKLNKSLGK